MKKILKKFIPCMLVLTIMLGAFPVTSRAVDRIEHVDYKRWMSQTWEMIKDKRYCDMVFIGTHDSGTYNLRYFDPFQVEEGLADTMHTISKIPLIWEAVRDIVKDVTLAKSSTQTRDIYGQLCDGIRVLDLRFKRYNGDNKLRTFHGMFSDDINEVVDQIKRYVSKSDKDIIYIDLNMAGFLWDMTAEDKRELGSIIRKELGQYIFNPEEFGWTKTMAELGATGKQIVINTTGEIAETLSPTLNNYHIPEAQHCSHTMETGVIPAITSIYNNNYRTTTDQNKLDKWFMMKLQYSWVPSEDLDPAVERFKAVDLVGGTKLLVGNILKPLRALVEEARPVIYDYMKNTGSADNENQPNVWLRDHYDRREVDIAISRNFGKNQSERTNSYKAISERLLDSSNDQDVVDCYNTMRALRYNMAELEGTEVPQDSEILTKKYGTSTTAFNFFVPSIGMPTKFTMRTGTRVDNVGLYSKNLPMRAGGDGGTASELALAADEYVNKITVSTGVYNNKKSIHYLEVGTNKDRKLSGGTRTNETYTYTAPDGWYLSAIGGRDAVIVNKKEIEQLVFCFKPVPNVAVQRSNAFGGSEGELIEIASNFYNNTAIELSTTQTNNRIVGIGIKCEGDSILRARGNFVNYPTRNFKFDKEGIRRVIVYRGRIDGVLCVTGLRVYDSANNEHRIGWATNDYQELVVPEGKKLVGLYGQMIMDKRNINNVNVYTTNLGIEYK